MTPYKGYTGRVRFDDERMVFHGRVEGIAHVITFEGRSADEVLEAFRGSVDDYLAWAAEEGFAPEVPFNGDVAIRVSPAQHRMLWEAADAAGQSVEEWARDALLRAAEFETRAKAG